MARLLAALIALVALSASCGWFSAASDGERENGPLLVAFGDDQDKVGLLDLENGDVQEIAPPAELAGSYAAQAVAGQDGRFVLIMTSRGVFSWERDSGVATFLGHGSRLIGASPAHRPELVLIEARDSVRLYDLGDGRELEVGPPGTSGPPRLTADEMGTVALVRNNEGGGVVVDLTDGSTNELDPDLFFPEDALRADGSLVVATRLADGEAEIVVGAPRDPKSMTVWLTPEKPEQQVSVGWAGGELVAVDFEGRVMVLGEGAVTEIGRLRETGLVPVGLHGETGSRRLLVEERDRDTGTRWSRVDPENGVETLPDLEGLEVVPFDAPPGHVLLGSSSQYPSFSHILAVPIDGGEPIELFRAEEESELAVRVHSPDVIGIWDFREPDFETKLIGLDGDSIATIDGGVQLAASPDGARLAVAQPGREPAMTITAIDGFELTGEWPGMRPLAWLAEG